MLEASTGGYPVEDEPRRGEPPPISGWAQAVVVKMGKRGAPWSRRASLLVPGYAVVDTTGAGDAFTRR